MLETEKILNEKWFRILGKSIAISNTVNKYGISLI